MAVKRVASKSTATKKKTFKRKQSKGETEAGALVLPERPKPVVSNPLKYTTLIYGREKIGKTVWASSFPKALFLATEPGVEGLDVFAFNHEDGYVKNWDIMRRAIDLLVEDKATRFKVVVIDTVDRAYDMALDWVCSNRGIEYPGEDAAGRNDYGKSWRAVKVEFSEAILRLKRAGYGIVFTSHAKELTIQAKGGDSYDRIIPTMSKQASNTVEALVDFFFYAEYVKDADGNNSRVLICEGDEVIWAGARSTPGGNFPKFLPLTKEGGYDILRAAFKGEAVGLDPSTLKPSKSGTKVGGDFVTRQRAKATKDKIKKKGGTRRN